MVCVCVCVWGGGELNQWGGVNRKDPDSVRFLDFLEIVLLSFFDDRLPGRNLGLCVTATIYREAGWFLDLHKI